MRSLKTLSLLFFFAYLLCALGCRKSSKTVSIKTLDSLSFRRSYASFQDLSDKELDSLQTTNPNAQFGNNLKVQTKLSELGLINNGLLKLSEFKNLDSFNLKSKSGNIINAYIGYDKPYSSCQITFRDKSDSAKISLNVDNPEIQFAFVDFITGDFPEIIVLRNVYIMNGDNYDINIYQISTN